MAPPASHADEYREAPSTLPAKAPQPAAAATTSPVHLNERKRNDEDDNYHDYGQVHTGHRMQAPCNGTEHIQQRERERLRVPHIRRLMSMRIREPKSKLTR